MRKGVPATLIVDVGFLDDRAPTFTIGFADATFLILRCEPARR
jgi:hypothetical protein